MSGGEPSSIKQYVPCDMVNSLYCMLDYMIFYSDFGLFYQVTQNSGQLYDTTNVIDTYVYRALLQSGNIGMASAAGFYQSIVGFACVLLANVVVRKLSPENAMF